MRNRLSPPEQAIALAKRWEGFHRVIQRRPVVLAAPYVCPAGYWTIGYGHLCNPGHPPITEEQGEHYLTIDLMTAVAGTIRQCPELLTEPPGRLAAIVDFTFNLGEARLKSSTLRKRIQDRNWNAAAHEIRRWVYGGGRKLPGLVLRREDEAQLLLNPE